jgi:DNA (cytosine-5)-methyltransferase 1
VRQAIDDLPAPIGTEISDLPAPLNLHFGRNPTPTSLKRYKAVPPGGNRFDLQRNALPLTPQCWIKKVSGGTDLFGRLWWDRPSVTIRTEFFKPEKGRYLHPEAHRPITHREAARLMGFPDSFVFKGSKVEIARQIGNAVPPLLGRAIAECVAEILKQTQQGVQAA